MTCGLYIHVPFCPGKCDYCSFYSVPPGGDRAGVALYLDALEGEIRTFAGENPSMAVDTVYFGGGTPSILEPEELARIMAVIKDGFDLDGRGEFTLEANPATAMTARLKGFHDAGINRIVLGVQTLRPPLHRLMGRTGATCTRGMVEDFIHIDGIDHCADIICGIPGEREGDLVDDLDFIARTGLVHLSCYTLTVEDSTPLGRRFAPPPGFNDFQAESFLLTSRTLKDRGYHHYEISNYALPGHESRHNMKYWTMQPYRGFGPGAHSFFGGRRFYNHASIDEYLAGHPPVTDIRDERSATVEFFLSGLRLLDGLCLDGHMEHLGRPVPPSVIKALEDQVEEGFLEMENINGAITVRLTGKGLLLADRVIYHVVEGLL